ncbi:MAG: hypothetical protein RR263_03195, partial [Oscillospiraceae bacterium]
TYLGLNKFVGADKPKMADFNSDNLTIDNHIKTHEENSGIHLTAAEVDTSVANKINIHEQNVGIHLTAATVDSKINTHEQKTNIHLTEAIVDGKVTAHEQKTGIHLTAANVDDAVTSKVNAHEQKTSIHLTAANVSSLIKAEYVIGTYSGDGTYKRSIALGFVPTFGLIFQNGEFVSHFDQIDATNYTGTAIASKYSCSKGVELTTDGFKVTQSQELPVDAQMINLNKAGGTYTYLMLK